MPPKTPSYPPWGKIDYALRLRFFLSFILAFLSFLSFIHSFILAFLPFFIPSSRGARIQPPPYRGIRGGLCKSIVIAM